MSVRIKDYTPQVNQTLLQKANVFLRACTEELVEIAHPKTPKDTGRMRADVLKQVLGLKGKVKWMKKYAVYQEKKQFKNYTTPGTGPHFAENAAKELVKKTGAIATQAGLKT